MSKYNFSSYNVNYKNIPNRHKENNNYVETIDDYGPAPIVFNMSELTSLNQNFRSTLWTGNHFQLTLMTIKPGEDIGLEVHTDVDQFFRIEDGDGKIIIGPAKATLNYQHPITNSSAIVVPAGFWHNIINTGTKPLRLFSIYAPPAHKHGTVNQTKPKNQNEKPY